MEHNEKQTMKEVLPQRGKLTLTKFSCLFKETEKERGGGRGGGGSTVLSSETPVALVQLLSQLSGETAPSSSPSIIYFVNTPGSRF